MAIIIYKNITAHRRRGRAAAAAQGEQRLSPDGAPPAQGAQPGTPQLADASAAASAGVPHTPARGGRTGTPAGSRPDGQAAKIVEAVSREPAARMQGGQGQVSRPAVIEVRGLRKSYDGVEAVAGIDLQVRAGEVFAFLGPNGAGKTTTVEILEGYRRRTAGDVSVLGVDPAGAGRDWRARIGVVLQESEPEAELTAEECLSLYAGYYPQAAAGRRDAGAGGPDRSPDRPVRPDVGRPAQAAGCGAGSHRRPGAGIPRRADHGFDPAARQSAWEVIAGLRDLGKTIFLTTHYMEEAEHLADRIAVLAAGQIVAEGSRGRPWAAGTPKRPWSASPCRRGVPAADLPPAVTACVTDGTATRSRQADPEPAAAASAPWPAGRSPRHSIFPTCRCTGPRSRTSTCN